ncbi:hypothetical protein GPSY_1102 [Paraglaciecola psychrophila 170]|nr:hypothetical protein GPSY_1102 [Paraglaciecola psychrophila 170]
MCAGKWFGWAVVGVKIDALLFLRPKPLYCVVAIAIVIFINFFINSLINRPL